MFKKLFSIKYQDVLILEMLEGAKSGAVASNIIGAAIVVSALYEHISTTILSIWFTLHILALFTRTIISSKLISAINNKYVSKLKYFHIYIFIISFTAILYGTISWISVLYNVPEINIFIIGTVIIALTAGSIATLGTIHLAFVNFMVLSIVPFILAMLYHGSFIFNTVAFIYTVFLIIHLQSGYRVFLSHRNALELEEKFKTIFNKSADGIAIIKNGRFTECNEAVIKMFGYENNMEKFLATPLSQLMPSKQEDSTSSIKKMLLMLKKANKDIITFEWQHIKKDGEVFWVEITLSPIRVNETQVIHGIWRNIDDRKQAEKEIYELNSTLESRVKEEVHKNREKDQHLLQQSRLAQMGEMISMIAHQWRQPLAAISSTSVALELKAYLDKTDKEMIIEHTQKISQYSQHLSSTIDDFRDFFKPTKDKKSTSYNKIIDSVLNIVQVTIENKNIEIIKDLNSHNEFNSYVNEIKQVVLNLFKNAEDVLLENKPSNPYIKISTFEENSKFILEISDNAGGVPKDIIKKIFDPYFSTKRDKNGTGLGLYMSQTIIKEHCKGKLSVRNSEDGAIFRIELG